MPETNTPPVADFLLEQAEELCGLHDHITRVIAGLDVPKETFSDRYPSPGDSDFEFEPVILMFLYQHTRGFNQSELYRRLTGTAYVYIRFELPRPPTQQAISYIWRNRLSLADRRTIEATARAIREIAADHGILSDGEPRLLPGEVDATEISDDHIMNAVEKARDRGLSEFESKRASNATFEDLVFYERQSYLNMADRGTTTRTKGSKKRYERLSDREKTPHGDTHLRTMKKTATPTEQTTLTDYGSGRKPTDWRRTRDEVLASFHRGVETILKEIRENGGIREPVIAAIDITPWPVAASPYKDDEDVERRDEAVVVNGRVR